MILKAEVAFLGFSGAMLGFCLSILACLFVVSANGLSGMPWAYELVVHLAYWPSRLVGTAPPTYFQANLVGNVMVNTLGWTIAGIVLALLRHGVDAAKKGTPAGHPAGATREESPNDRSIS